MATTTLTQGIEAYETKLTFGDGIDVTGTGTFSDSITGTGVLQVRYTELYKTTCTPVSAKVYYLLVLNIKFIYPVQYIYLFIFIY